MAELPLLLVANERPLISVDATLLINIALWLVLFFLLRGLLWQPMLKLIEKREEGMEGSRDDARRLQLAARAKQSEYEAALKRARTTAASERDKLRAEALKRDAEITGAARAKLAAAIEVQRTELARQREALGAEIRTAVPALAEDIAAKVLGREVRS